MKTLKMYQVDAFASRVFEGNSAVIVPLDEWLPEHTMQAIAMENNLSETAFFVPSGTGFHIRWFTPTKEVKLCGHATLAAAFVLFNQLEYQHKTIHFDSLSGALSVTQQTNGRLTLDFPEQMPTICDAPDALIDGLGKVPMTCLQHENYIAVFETQAQIESLTPNFEQLKQLNLQGVIATAPGNEHDFVARFFAPKFGINEDPVTGSAYTQLTPYWSKQLNQTQHRARQLSERGGEISCALKNGRVMISGQAVLYMKGEFYF